MIPIRRGKEPSELAEQRWWRLARALVRHLQDGIPPDNADLDNYQCAKKALLEAQANKCAYCEQGVREGALVEHFRPKNLYWWLTWTWTNLLVSCHTCNDPAHKGSHFDLDDPSTRLAPEEQPPGRERPSLLDPSDSTFNPISFIGFRLVRGQWQPVARNGDRRGNKTIRTFGLDVGPIINAYQAHVENFRDRLEAMRNALNENPPNQTDIDQRWKRLVGDAFAKQQPFQGLMYDVLAAEFPAETRAKWGLSLPLPGGDLPPDPPFVERVAPAHAPLGKLLALRVRALGQRPSAKERNEVIFALCADKPRARKELAEILERGEEHLRGVLADLESSGQLALTDSRYHRPA